MEKNEKNILLSAKTLTKSNVWNLSENDIVTILENASKEIDIDTQFSKLLNTIKCAFDIEEPGKDNTLLQKSLEKRGFHLADVTINSNNQMFIAIKKHAINRVTDLTYQNIGHISAQKLLDLIDRNFGGGWDSLSQPVKDVIQSGFLITSSSMPKSRRVEESALYMKKVAEGFDVLQVEKGSWVELIFAKQKETVVKDDLLDEEDLMPKRRRRSTSPLAEADDDDDDDLNDDELNDNYGDSTDDDDDDDFNEDELTAESYRTVVDEDPEDLDVNSIEDEEEDY